MPPPTEKRGRAIVWVPIVLVALSAGFALGGVCGYFYEKLTHEKTDREVEIPETIDRVVALGRIEPRDGILSLGVAAPDRIREINVEEDDLVTVGKTLVTLESKKMRELEEQMAQIQLEQADLRLKAIKRNGEAQINVAKVRRARIQDLLPIERKILENKIKLLEDQKTNAQRNYQRYVAAGDTIAGMDKEKQKLSEQQIQTDIDATNDQIDKLRKSSQLDLRVAAAELEATKAELQQTESTISLEVLGKQVQQAEERRKETEILAPSDGKILRIFAHKGELVQTKPILQMANVNKMIVLAEVDEKDIQSVAPGQSAIITSPSNVFDKDCSRLTGRVVWKANNVGKAEVIPLDPRATVSDRVVSVKVEVDRPECVAKLIGLQVRVEITTKKATEAAR
jgi:HlyD family secretion protein